MTVHAATIQKADNATALNLAGSWSGGVVPGAGDIASWDSTVTSANTASLGANTSYSGIIISDPSGAVTVNGAFGFTLGAAGIDMSAATQNLTLGMTGSTGVAAFTIGASQTWHIASARTLSIVPNHTVGNDRTLDITGLGQVTNSGWLQVGSTSGSVASNGIVNHTGGTWSSSAAATVLFIGHAGTAALNANTGTYNLSGGTVALSGSQEIRLGNQSANAEGVMNVTSGSITSSTATTVLKAGYVNGSKGAYIQSGGVVTLGRMEVASSIAASLGSGTTGTASVSAGSLSLTTLAIGTLNNGSFTLSGSGILNLSGAATVGSAATSSGTLNLNGGTLNLATTSAAITKSATGVVNAAGGKISNQAGANVSLNTAMVLGTDGLTIAPSVQNSNRWVTLSGNLTGTGGLTLNATGTNTVVLSGSNSFSGAIDLQSGYLGNSSVNAIPTGVAATVNGSWRLDNDVVLSTLDGSGNFFRGNGSSLLTVGHGDASSSFAGNINTNATQIISLTKIGAGTLTLTANNSTYIGNTTVKAGTLKLEGNGSIGSSPTIVIGDVGSSGAALDVTAKTGGFTVGAGQTLMGIGTISGNASIAGTHAAGNSVGLQSFSGSLSYLDGSIFRWELGSNTTSGRGTAFDAVNIVGDLGIENDAIFEINLGNPFNPADPFWGTSRSWNVFEVSGLRGSFLNFRVVDPTAPGSFVDYASYGDFSYGYTGDSGVLTWSAVPEPSSVALVGGLISLGLTKRRRQLVL